MIAHARGIGEVKTTFTPPKSARWVDELADTESLDKAAGVLEPLAKLLSKNPEIEAALRGNFLGHALHPLLTDLPIGFWMSALALDFTAPIKGKRASRRLTALGILTSLPTAAAGLVEWKHSSNSDKRIGTVHALTNVSALAAFTVSYVARRSDKSGWGRVFGLFGGAALAAGGYLGGHLAIARKVGSHTPIAKEA